MFIAPEKLQADTAKDRASVALTDVRHLRDRIMKALERARAAEDENEQRRLATFVVIGADPSGVALAGSIAEVLREKLQRSAGTPQHKVAARVILTDAAIRVLPGFARSLSSIARGALQQLGVELRLGVPVSTWDDQGVLLAGKRIPSATVLWAGDYASPAIRGFAPICRGFAVAEFGPLHLSGSFAWLVWRAVRLWQTASLVDRIGSVGPYVLASPSEIAGS